MVCGPSVTGESGKCWVLVLRVLRGTTANCNKFACKLLILLKSPGMSHPFWLDRATESGVEPSETVDIEANWVKITLFGAGIRRFKPLHSFRQVFALIRFPEYREPISAPARSEVNCVRLRGTVVSPFRLAHGAPDTDYPQG
jgi:hypothetical protein